METYYRPLAQTDAARPPGAVPLAGGWAWFAQAECLRRDGFGGLVPVAEIPQITLARLTAARAPIAGVAMDRPRLMGILNVTPDSFSDGGQFVSHDTARDHAALLIAEGADFLDIGGESTRPGAAVVPVDQEIARTRAVIAEIARHVAVPISIDTRKAGVARAAIGAGARMLNDISAFGYDPEMATLAATTGVPVCLMHAQGTPQTMQQNPGYANVLLDVYDFLEERIAAAEVAGISRDRIVIDPGIGFGKTVAHNLLLLRNLSLFHGLGCAILVGASRKKFIGVIGDEPDPRQRFPGSMALALAGIAQGVQITRVHDMRQTKQALGLWQAVMGSEG